MAAGPIWALEEGRMMSSQRTRWPLYPFGMSPGTNGYEVLITAGPICHCGGEYMYSCKILDLVIT
jgi:hypothetical protein